VSFGFYTRCVSITVRAHEDVTLELILYVVFNRLYMLA